ncbi:unnamed protein product [Rotaria sp. Silwood2]|nr:unnamed protein product [Rotaria sp. Silwood2]
MSNSNNDQSTKPENPYKDDPHIINPENIPKHKTQSEVQQEIAQKHLELVEKQFLDSIAKFENKNMYLEREIEKLREEKNKMAMYHQQLEHALAQEVENRERREIEKQRILEIKRDTPSYWGTNALAASYREIEIHPDFPEFNIINELLNSTIESHGNEYGTIYGKDPTDCTKQEDLEFSIILYRAVLGDLHIAKKYKKETYRGKDKHRVCRPPYKPNSCNLYDSVMGESKKYGGDKLEYREFILYESAQAYPEYVIKFKRSAANIHAPSNMQQLNTKWYNFLQNTYKLRPE